MAIRKAHGMKKLRRIGIASALLITLAGAFMIAGRIEQSRTGAPLPHPATTAAAAPVVDGAVLMEDVAALASPKLAGRGTGTEGSRLAQAYIIGRFRKIGIEPFGDGYAMPFSFTHHSVKGLLTAGRKWSRQYPSAVNLIGRIPGSVNADHYLVVSAHYDHLGERNGVIYPGADDNASGVAAMLAVAAHFKAHPPRNTIVFAAFDGEELGLQGARAFVNAPPFPLSKVALDLNFDMVSRSDRNQIFAAGTRYTPALSALVAKAAAGSSVNLLLGHDRPLWLAGAFEDWTASSDHAAFHDKGIAFLYFGVEDHADYHQPGDTVDKIEPGLFLQVVRLLVSVAVNCDQNLDPLK